MNHCYCYYKSIYKLFYFCLRLYIDVIIKSTFYPIHFILKSNSKSDKFTEEENEEVVSQILVADKPISSLAPNKLSATPFQNVIKEGTNKRVREEEENLNFMLTNASEDDDDDDDREKEIKAKKSKQAKLNSFFTPTTPNKKSTSADTNSGIVISPRENKNYTSPPGHKKPTAFFNRESPFTMRDKRSFFSNRIGVDESVIAAPDRLNATSVDSSFAERVDLHLCERIVSPMRSPSSEAAKTIKRASSGDVDDDHDNHEKDELAQYQSISRKEIVLKNPVGVHEHLRALGLFNDTQQSNNSTECSMLMSNETASSSSQKENYTLSSGSMNSTLTQVMINMRKEKKIGFSASELRKQHKQMIERVKEEKGNEKKRFIKLYLNPRSWEDLHGYIYKVYEIVHFK